MTIAILFVALFTAYIVARVELPPIITRYKAHDAELTDVLRNICPIVVTRQTFLDELWSGRENDLAQTRRAGD